ncbi:MAG: protein kinase domain-containing protein [Anaerolineae bacterium]
MIDEIIGNRYRVLRELGKGGMAWVYLAEDLQEGGFVAVKVLYPHFSEDAAYIQRFNREAKLASLLSDPHIVRVLDYGASRDVHYLVMEYIEGRTLKDILQERGPLPYRDALEIAHQVAQALEHANRYGIVHRDIKPQNLMLTAEGMVKVLDFGIARAETLPSLTRSGFVGSPYYISPEQALGEKVDIRSDIYSLGIVLYEMLSGDLPFDAKTPWSIVNKHITAEPPCLHLINSELPSDVEWLMNKALSKRPEERFQTPRGMMQAIEAILAGEEIPEEVRVEKPKGRVERELFPAGFGRKVAENGQAEGRSPVQAGRAVKAEVIVRRGADVELAAPSRAGRAAKLAPGKPKARKRWIWGVLVAVISLITLGGVIYAFQRQEFSPGAWHFGSARHLEAGPATVTMESKESKTPTLMATSPSSPRSQWDGGGDALGHTIAMEAEPATVTMESKESKTPTLMATSPSSPRSQWDGGGDALGHTIAVEAEPATVAAESENAKTPTPMATPTTQGGKETLRQLPAPRLAAPANGAIFTAGPHEKIILQWEPVPGITDEEFYNVTVVHFFNSEPRYWGDATRETNIRFPPETNYGEADKDIFHWWVEVRHITNIKEDGKPDGPPVSPKSEAWTFTWR